MPEMKPYFNGGYWTVSAFNQAENCKNQAEAMALAHRLIVQTKHPALLTWFAPEDWQCGGIPYGIVAVNGRLIFLSPAQVREAGWKEPT